MRGKREFLILNLGGGTYGNHWALKNYIFASFDFEVFTVVLVKIRLLQYNAVSIGRYLPTFRNSLRQPPLEVCNFTSR